MDPPQILFSTRWRSSKINSIISPSFITWDSSHYPMASDISGRRPSEYTSYSTSNEPEYSNADNIAIRKASLWDATTSTTVMINSVVPSGFNTSVSPAPRYASTWDSFVGPSHNPVASDISGKSLSEYTAHSTSQAPKNSNNASNIATRFVASWYLTTAIHSPRWDAFGDALPLYDGAAYWSWVAKTISMTSTVSSASRCTDAPLLGINRVFYAGNIDYVYDFRHGKRLAMADIEAIMYVYGVENTSAQDIVKKVDPKKRGIFDINSHNKQIVLASTIDFSHVKELDLSKLRHASKCYQDNLLSPLYFSCYIREVLKGKYLGSEPRFMILGIYSILGVLEGSTNRELTTKDVEKFVRLWKARNTNEVEDLVNMIKDDNDGTISCSGFYYLLYRRQWIQIFDTLGEQNPSMFFPLMDKDEDGFLSSTDLRSFAAIFGRYPSDEVIDHVTRKLDIDSDGKISLEDFHGAMEPILDGLAWEFWLVAILITLEL